MKRRIPKEYPVRGEYFRDQTAIIHSLPFRRLKHKTQVFPDPENDHVCTRIEHVLHVATIAASICRGLNRANPENWNLDPELAYAAGLGHDLGHAPFGHAGEDAISRKLPPGIKFMHELNGLRIIDHLTDDGRGLNLTSAVRDAVACHNGEKFEKEIRPDNTGTDPSEFRDRSHNPATFEGCVVRFSDKIAYLGRDIEDAITTGLIRATDPPPEIRLPLGKNNGEIINALVTDLIVSSSHADSIRFSDETHELLVMLKDFNYARIYGHRDLLRHNRVGQDIVGILFDHLAELHETLGSRYEKYGESGRNKLDAEFGDFLRRMESLYRQEQADTARIVTDYVSGMTDGYAVRCMVEVTGQNPMERRSVF
jgi:dGTPase